MTITAAIQIDHVTELGRSGNDLLLVIHNAFARQRTPIEERICVESIV